MRRRVFVLLLCALVASSSGWPSVLAAGDDQVVLLVELKEHSALRQLRQDLRQHPVNIRPLGRQAPGRYQAGAGVRVARDLRRWVAIDVPAEYSEEFTGFLQQHRTVARVTREKMYEAALLPNDPLFLDQYGLVSDPAPLADINAPAAWERTTGSAAVVIAIIDGGVDLIHEDLRDKIWTNADEIAGNGLDDDGNNFVDDVNGWDFVLDEPAAVAAHHATHVAGIAAASGNNARGVAGVDWGARIMSVRVLSGSGLGGEAEIVQGINYAVANGADVINMSIVGPTSAALSEAIENAYAAGVVVVAAAGNNGSDTGITHPQPACGDLGGVNMVLGVGATNEAGTPASFSNYGECLDVSAPGRRIMSTRNNSRYGEMTGTSMSAPFAAGVAGLYLAAHPGASAAQTLAALTDSRAVFTGADASEVAAWNSDYKGLLDAAAAVAGSGNNSVPSPAPSANPADKPQSGGESDGGDHGASSGGGGGGGGGDDEQAEAPVVQKPRVAGAIAIHPKANLALLRRTQLTFNYVFGRYPKPAERLYWDTRIKKGEKRTYEALLGAMAWQRAHKK